MGRAKMERWVQGAVNSRGKRQTNVHESAEKRKSRLRTGLLGGVVTSLQSAAPSEDVLLYSQQLLVRMS